MITKEIDEQGTIYYYNDLEQLHREDGPAVEYINGYKEWYLNGKRHREDGPAVELANGTKYWYLNGEYHTEQEFNELTLKKRLQKILDL